MVRSLPWLQKARDNNASLSTSTNHSPTRISARKRRRVDSGGVDKNEIRTPSTSPPPQAPTDTPMKSSDAAWIMVEDEFTATAQTFTHHLHHAEYKRLKTLTAKRMNDSLPEIVRPVTGNKLNRDTRIKLNARKQREKFESTFRHTTDQSAGSGETANWFEESEEEDIAIGDKDLACLMQGTGGGSHQKRSLLDVAGHVQSNTRAAAGFNKRTKQSLSKISDSALDPVSSPPNRSYNKNSHLERSEEETDDDLEANSEVDKRYVQRRQVGQSSSASVASALTHTNSIASKQGPGLSALNEPNSKGDSKNLKGGSMFSASDELLLPRRSLKQEKPKENNEKRVVHLDEIPTFLF